MSFCYCSLAFRFNGQLAMQQYTHTHGSLNRKFAYGINYGKLNYVLALVIGVIMIIITTHLSHMWLLVDGVVFEVNIICSFAPSFLLMFLSQINAGQVKAFPQN